jgi:hypothetical protein
LRVPASIQPRPTRRAELLVSLVSSSSPIGPSITLRICASSLNTKGMLKTFSSSTMVPIGPTEMRAIWSAPTCACSVISFSPPSCIDGYICTLYLPLVAFSSLLPRRTMASTVG